MDTVNDQVEVRRKFVEAWNKAMIDIWQEKIFKYHIIDTGNLYQSPMVLGVRADGRFYDLTLSQKFLEYGIWQDLGTGRNTAIGNTHKRNNDGWTNKRERRPWMSPKYYASVMNLRDFYAESCGQEFVGMFANLDADVLRSRSKYYRRKGLS